MISMMFYRPFLFFFYFLLQFSIVSEVRGHSCNVPWKKSTVSSCGWRGGDSRQVQENVGHLNIFKTCQHIYFGVIINIDDGDDFKCAVIEEMSVEKKEKPKQFKMSANKYHENNLFDFEKERLMFGVFEFITATKTHALNMCFKFNGPKHFENVTPHEHTVMYFVVNIEYCLVLNWKCAVIVAMSLVNNNMCCGKSEVSGTGHFTKFNRMFNRYHLVQSLGSMYCVWNKPFNLQNDCDARSVLSKGNQEHISTDAKLAYICTSFFYSYNTSSWHD